MRYVIISGFILFFVSCSKFNIEEKINTNMSSNGTFREITINEIKTKKILIDIMYSGEQAGFKDFPQLLNNFVQRFSIYNEIKSSNTGILKIEFNGNIYRLFYQLGLFFLSDMKNDLIKYGIIQMEWNDLLLKNNNQFLGPEKYNLIRISDFSDLMNKYGLNNNDLLEVYPYTVKYLLNQILFISPQEILSRPARYLTENELENIFCQVVILPEVTEFTAYIKNKFGINRLLMLSESEFTIKNWKSISGEEMSDTEGGFAKNIENKNFQGIFLDKGFTGSLDRNLELYNKITKPTLFKK